MAEITTHDPVHEAATERELLQATARVLGARVTILYASSPSEIEPAFATLVGQRAGALVVAGETFFFTQRDRLVELAAHHAVPTIYPMREFVVAGGLMSYGVDLADAYRRVGVQTGRYQRTNRTSVGRGRKSTFLTQLRHRPADLL
jgi:putative tryptophan/tyrosine transport system substrate-binding protein